MSSSNSVKSPLQHMLSRAIMITNIRTYRDTECFVFPRRDESSNIPGVFSYQKLDK